MAPELRVVVELERTTDCSSAQWHTRHDEAKYDRYETNFKAALDGLVGDEDFVWSKNPGPRSYGMHCRPSLYNKKVWHTMVKNDLTQKWTPDVTFCYPRVGAFEVCVVKGQQRVPIFSKLENRKWPHPEWLAKRVVEVVEGKLDGWSPLAKQEKVKRKHATKKMSDDGLRKVIKNKFSTLVGAFRAFDKNGDGNISKTEFRNGLRAARIDLPEQQLEELWSMADEDGSGNLQYQEFVRKFAAYKATAALHRHTDFRKDGKQALLQKLHGVNATSRVQKHSAIRASKDSEWGVEGSELASNPEALLDELNIREATIHALARNEKIMAMPIEEMEPDMIRAKIQRNHGGILNAFRHFDFDGDGQISYDEFFRHMPTVLGEPISQEKMEFLWREFDPDLSGAIDMNEFASSKCFGGHRATQRGVAIFKGQAVDPTLATAHVKIDRDTVVGELRYSENGRMSQLMKDGHTLNNTNLLNGSSSSEGVASTAASPGLTEMSAASPQAVAIN